MKEPQKKLLTVVPQQSTHIISVPTSFNFMTD